jgi:hypothetical protein
MTDRNIDQDEESYQRDQAEGERDDAMETAVTRGRNAKPSDTRQESTAERDPAEGREDPS